MQKSLPNAVVYDLTANDRSRPTFAPTALQHAWPKAGFLVTSAIQPTRYEPAKPPRSPMEQGRRVTLESSSGGSGSRICGLDAAAGEKGDYMKVNWSGQPPVFQIAAG